MKKDKTDALLKKAEKTVAEHRLIDPGDHIVLGLSGGPDSLCLFYLLMDMAQSRGIKIHAVHVNHKFRPGSAERDQIFVENICRENGIECSIVVADCAAIAAKEGITGEEAGRKVRYEAFADTARRLIADGIPADRIKTAVAHNMNDQAETVLFRILRGTGTDGLAGMEYIRKEKSGMTLIRPLLDICREEIEGYCAENALEPCRDETNEKPLYARNRIRLELLPYLKENYNGNIEDALVRLCRVAAEDRTFFDAASEISLKDALICHDDEKYVLDMTAVRSMDPALRHRVIMKVFDEAGLPQDISYAHMVQADRIIEKGRPSLKAEFPHGYVMETGYGRISIYKRKEKIYKEVGPELVISVKDKDDDTHGPGAAFFDLDRFMEKHGAGEDISEIICIRTRKPGDFMALPGSGGRKKLQDLMTDMKVPRDFRDRIYMAAAGSEILWIPEGMMKARFSGNYRTDDSTKRILILEIKKTL